MDAASRRGHLIGIELRALVAQHLGRAVEVEPEPIPDGAALVIDGTAWVRVRGSAARALGPAMAWALRRDASALNLIAETDTGLLARRAERFTTPIEVWFPVERELLPAVREPLAPPVAPAPEHLALSDRIVHAGAEVVIEHGVVAGEVRGLEVCRVVDEATVGYLIDESGVPVAATMAGDADQSSADGLRLEVGIGAADREAFHLLHGDAPTPDALAAVVRSVAAHRRVDAPHHALNRLARERFNRWRVLADPALVGAVSLEATEPPVPRPNLKDPVPCVAAGRADDGGPVTVVFSTGVYLDLVPFLADVQAITTDRVRVALPRADLVPLTRDLAATLSRPVELVTVD